jgi:hypothetical protein
MTSAGESWGIERSGVGVCTVRVFLCVCNHSFSEFTTLLHSSHPVKRKNKYDIFIKIYPHYLTLSLCVSQSFFTKLLLVRWFCSRQRGFCRYLRKSFHTEQQPNSIAQWQNTRLWCGWFIFDSLSKHGLKYFSSFTVNYPNDDIVGSQFEPGQRHHICFQRWAGGGA